MSLIEDIANHLADMPSQTLGIYCMQFPADVINCIAIFPTGGGVGGDIGVGPSYYTANGTKPGAIDYPGIQIQVRASDPFNAFRVCEEIRLWLDMNEPAGYLQLKSNRSQPDDLTSTNDLQMSGGPAYRFSCDYSLIKVRS